MVEQEKKQNISNSQEILQEDRYLWMARAFSIVALLSLISVILMVVALSGLTPLLRVQPFWIRTQAKEDQVITITRPPAEKLKSKELQEALAREYLINRYTVTSDVDEMVRVWGQEGPIAAMSSEAVYKKFWDTEVLNYGRGLDTIKDIKEDGLTRTMDFMDFGLSSQQTNVEGEFYWEGRIATRSMSLQKSVPDERKICVWLRTSFAPESENRRSKMTWAQRFRNPLGFKIVDFAAIRLGEDGRCHWGKE